MNRVTKFYKIAQTKEHTFTKFTVKSFKCIYIPINVNKLKSCLLLAFCML